VARLHDRAIGSKWRENPSLIHERRVAFRSDLHLLRHERITDGEGLRRACLLMLVLGHRTLIHTDQRLARYAVENVNPARLARLRQGLAHAPVDLYIEKHNRAWRIVVPDVMADLLEMPAVLARSRLDGHDRSCKEIVTFTDIAVEVRTRISRREVHEPEFRIDGRRLPDGRAAVFIDLAVSGPCIVAYLAGIRHRVERPNEFAAARIERPEAALDAVFCARETRNDESVIVEWRARDTEPILPAFRLYGPDDLAVALVQCDELAVELADINLAVAHRQATARPTAANYVDGLIEIRFVGPQRLARVDTDREDVVGSSNDINDPGIDDRRGFARIFRTNAGTVQACPPDTLEVRDIVAVDLRKRRVSLVVDVAAVRDPTIGRQVRQCAAGEGWRPGWLRVPDACAD